MNKKITIFSSNKDIRKNAYMNWAMDKNENSYNLYVMAQGYAKATNILLESTLKDNIDKKADIIIFPILYNVNHTIELYEKSILYILAILNNEEYSIPTSHNINQLFHEMLSKIKKEAIFKKGLDKNFSVLKNYIEDLYSYIEEQKNKPHMDFSRYPIDTNKDSYFYIKSNENIVVDLEKLNIVFYEIVNSLTGISVALFELINV